MITADGKTVIKRFQARQVNQIGGSLAFGVGSAAPNINDKRLQYEVVRVPIRSVNVDPNTDHMVFQAQLPAGSIKTIYEVGLWSSTLSTVDEGYTLGILGPVSGAWTNGTLTSNNARANANALQVNYSASGTTNAELYGFSIDLSKFTDGDSVVFGYHATANLSGVRVRLGTNSTNYFEFALPSPTANSYNVARLARGAANRTGSPDWERISYVAVRPSGTSAGSGSIFFDGIRLEPYSLSDTDLLVARSVLSTPHNVDQDMTSDVEYALKVTVA